MHRNSSPQKHLVASSLSTRDKIFHVALDLFYRSSYESVSMRDIAQAANVKIPTIYNHFESKEAILQSFYDFYKKHWSQAIPNIDKLLPLVGIKQPYELLTKVKYRFDPALQQTMGRIFCLAVRDINFKRSEEFIQVHVIDTVNQLLRPLLETMLAMGQIEPLDIDVFLCLVTNYAFSAAFLSDSTFHITQETWFAGLDMLYSIIKPTNDSASRTLG